MRTAEGVFTALATPFRGDRVDRDALARLVEAQVAAGVAGLCPCGTTGESPTISEDEHREIVETVVAAARGRVPVVAGTGSNDTRHAVALTKQARAAGAVGALVVSPYYNKPTQEGLYRHFRAVADDGGLPVMLYHIPGRTAGAIEVETVARLWKAGGMFALKEAQGHVDRVTRLREACGIPILSGDDALTLPFVSLGAVGVVSVASNVAPAKVVAMVRDALAGRRAEALAAHEALTPLFRALFQETNPIPVKAALKLLGIFPSDEVRLPLVPASPAVLSALRASLGTPGS
ncbi:MAG: 4-hydroxy-tetrahydrodipicolinate synthase [Planctomycetia bacterium]|nr:4-hydroxy-tetrahydrodipicolinate synthase [Planctomycetia bacterium]